MAKSLPKTHVHIAKIVVEWEEKVKKYTLYGTRKMVPAKPDNPCFFVLHMLSGQETNCSSMGPKFGWQNSHQVDHRNHL